MPFEVEIIKQIYFPKNGRRSSESTRRRRASGATRRAPGALLGRLTEADLLLHKDRAGLELGSNRYMRIIYRINTLHRRRGDPRKFLEQLFHSVTIYSRSRRSANGPPRALVCCRLPAKCGRFTLAAFVKNRPTASKSCATRAPCRF
ncbi:hypothetical protein EVAR_23701_1 [Eumeta japonica]|uniref:Uncharacterized protein n=1 Tax=Eumeta variegata TaxID=151549 RepID=A0A4C1VIC9_EUMVA|nr:hypothetical protein EVAR_23701_1 [Eumeta japonica]